MSDGAEIIILSDRPSPTHPSDTSTYIPPMVAVGAVHHALIDAGLRMETGIVVETGAAWTTHQIACLVGYGAHAVHPYVALESIQQWHGLTKTKSQMKMGKIPSVTVAEAQANFKSAIEAGVLKILSKIGISLLSSYQGAQIFEAIGISEEVVDVAFKGTTSRIGGLSFEDIANEVVLMRPDADATKLGNFGYYKPVANSGE